MAYSTVLSAALAGLEVMPVRVEADISNGLPMLQMVGYLSSEVKEASQRVRTAIHNSGIELPARKMIVNLAPATVRKRGASFDLPIALALLASLGEIRGEYLERMMIAGELGLDGSVQKISGVLPIVLKAREIGCHTCVIPKENALEGALVSGIEIIGVGHLKEICQYLKEEKKNGKIEKSKNTGKQTSLFMNESIGNLFDYGDIRGQAAVKRAAEVAVAGGHNLLLIGPPGSSKSMIASRIPSILPPLSLEESIEITKIYSVLGMLDEKHPLITTRPFRSVHHTVTKAALIGGGNYPLPGEISMAHGGVLFLDELTEFQKSVLEVLRQPLEEHRIRLSRSHGNYCFPANFMLTAAMNPCPCGNYPNLNRCNCTSGQISHYLSKISQPFLDRMDICIEAPRMEYETLSSRQKVENSSEIRKRVCQAREIQKRRYRKTPGQINATLNPREIEKYCHLGEREEWLMRQAFQTMGLTARTYHKVLKVARTIADMEESREIRELHLKEALGYRTIDKKYWGR